MPQDFHLSYRHRLCARWVSRHPVDGHFLKKIVLYVAKYHLGKVRPKPMQPAVSPLKVRDLAVEQPSGDLQGSCASPHYSTVLLADLCRFLLPLFPPSWYACFLVSIQSGKLFPLISFSVTVPAVSGHFLGWFLLLGLPWIPPFSLWLPANPLRTSSQAHLFVTSLIFMLLKLFV